ncbi:ABC transporter permease [Hoeflea sp. WL0058]|uniref:ABC transporter permease n=1 Tax=Flavimaribacter sediminis TaxID=2865987 RepID=A0AAE2ZKA4_9HYPH|nr:ABC transporter permease [Flavimaribacter sediminis]MBW8637559.1 ABC transporter permease [Flavimaribacter sediminis]
MADLKADSPASYGQGGADEKSAERKWLRDLTPFIPIIALGVLAALTIDGFGTAPNLIAIVQASAITGIAAIGVAAITICGKFVSLSIEQQAVTSAYVFAALYSAGTPVALAMLAALLVSALLGLIQGYLVSRGLNPIVTTLAFGSALFGAVVLLADNRTITLNPNPIAWLGGGTTFGVPNQAIIFLILVAIGSFLLSRTKIGRQLVLTGANPEAAELVGIPTKRIVMIAFIVAALAAAIVGILVVGQVSQAKSDMFRGLTIDVVAAVLVGGIAIQGGEGQLWRAGYGAIVLTMLSNVMLLLGVDAGARELLKGLLAGAVLIFMTVLRNRSR